MVELYSNVVFCVRKCVMNWSLPAYMLFESTNNDHFNHIINNYPALIVINPSMFSIKY